VTQEYWRKSYLQNIGKIDYMARMAEVVYKHLFQFKGPKTVPKSFSRLFSNFSSCFGTPFNQLFSVSVFQ